ncbi:MAG: DUF6427 family protein [Saprospiraceae bacterium]
MLGLFRSYYAFNHLFLLGYIFIIRHVGLLDRITYQGTERSWLFQHIQFTMPSSWLQNFIAIILLWLHSILINNIVNSNKLSKETGLLSGLFYVLLMSMSSEGLSLHPILLANTFLLLGIHNIMESSKEVDIRHLLFNTGLFLSLAAFIYPPYFVIVVLGLLGFNTVKSFKAIGLIQYIIGIISSFIIILGIQYLIQGVISFQLPVSIIDHRVWSNSLTPNTLIFVLSFVFCLLFMLIQYPGIISKKNIQTRKKIELFYLLILFSIIVKLIFFYNQSLELTILALPVGLLLGIWAAENKSVVFAEIIHLMLLVCLFILHYNIF